MITEKDFTVEEKATIQKVVEYLANNCGMFEGKFAPTADGQFVTGIETVMLTLAFMAGDEYGQKFDDRFSTNWYKSKWEGLKK